ncbi:DUF1501 domain-containing protein [Horticoccus sp. 23ND18S-11]|uniref:DUF1501 domain-containing protein n=1 Tax=Horticoccus sp. 23ND18S-11 TaxID=3391832 RepID=UPI0039C9845E
MSSSRRHFLGQCCSAVGTTGILSTLAQLRAIGAVTGVPSGSPAPARAGAVPSDYKAIVCIFLAGGNDANNLIIPSGTAYSSYATQRNVIAVPNSGLLPITPRTSDGRAWALHPGVPELRTLFNSGKCAFLANVGTLVEPTTLAEYTAGTVKLPPQLYSHNDQQVQWQSSVPDQPFRTGWGGRTADLLDALNTNNQISMSISLDSFNNFEVGRSVTQFSISPAGVISFTGSNDRAGTSGAARYAAQKDLYAASNPNLFAAAFGNLSSDALGSSELLSSTLAAAPVLSTVFPANSATTPNKLADQLKMIAKLISVSSTLGVKRQIFFARLGGWDLHADQVDEVNKAMGAHASLLAQVSRAMNAFYDATVELGCADRVTTFTASDFGRTYSSNGDGSDHGWGNHQIIVGGAVKGGDIYGRMPSLAVNGPDDTGRGRWIPSTSVDEYGATIARWFGVSETNLSTAFPNIGRFAKPNLGFMT